MVFANEEATEPSVHSGQVEFIASNVFQSTQLGLTVTEYLCHRCPHVPFVVVTIPSPLSLLIIGFLKSNTTDSTGGAGTAYISGSLELILDL